MRVTQRKRRTVKKARPVRHASPATAVAATSTRRRVLIATDGSRPSVAAIKLSRAMEQLGFWTPRVITVCEPLPVSIAGTMLPAPTQYEVLLTDSLITDLQRQLRRYGGADWPLTVEFGRAGPLIVRTAREADAELIIIGLGHHTAVARLFGAETAARVIRHTDKPVLAVHPSTKKLPRLGVVAMDFGESSVRAAREALALLEPPARLHLVHVTWGYNATSLQDVEWERAYNSGVEQGFTRLHGELHRSGVEVTTQFVQGGVVDTVLATARRLRADLIALGSHSQTVFDRLVIGSTPAEVLRQATCSVLIAPPSDQS